MVAPLIAVVDDDSAFVEMVGEILADEGYRTTTSLAARDAWTVIQNDHPDLIVLDIHLEHPQGGWDLLENVRRDPATAHIPIIVCSGDSHFLKAKAESIVAHAVDVLEKPFNIKHLVKMIAHRVGSPDEAV